MDLSAVDLAGMKTAQGSFQSASDETSATWVQMDGQIEGLRGAWTGEAASIFHSAMQSWLDDLQKVNNSLNAMLRSLEANTGVNANTHEQTQEQASQLMQVIASGNFSGLPGFPA